MLDYNQVPYRGIAIRTADPWRMAWTAQAHGGPHPTLSQARVLELGCGDGANIIAIAAHHPSWQALGVDYSLRAVADATATARESELENVSFARADVAELEVEPGAWDFVIAHGLYSWIDADRRTALRRVIRRALAPNGLAYVSFNALAGWAVRGRVRDALVRTGPPTLEGSRALLARLSGYRDVSPWGQLLAREIERAQAASDHYLAHEYLVENNDAFWVGDFVRDAEQSGLRWLGDAQFNLDEGRPYEALRESLETPGLPGEELADLLGYRQLRCAVLARDDAAGEPPSLAGATISGVVRGGDPFELSDAVEEKMQSASGVEIRVRNPLGKMALLELARRYPDGLTLAELLAQAQATLDSYGIRSGDERVVTEGVASLWKAGALEMRLGRERVSRSAGPRPRASAFTRSEARLRPTVTSVLHVPIPLEPIEREIVARLDGTRSTAELIEAMAGELQSGAIELEGMPSSHERALPSLWAGVERVTELLARWGLVE